MSEGCSTATPIMLSLIILCFVLFLCIWTAVTLEFFVRF